MTMSSEEESWRRRDVVASLSNEGVLRLIGYCSIGFFNKDLILLSVGSRFSLDAAAVRESKWILGLQ